LLASSHGCRVSHCVTLAILGRIPVLFGKCHAFGTPMRVKNMRLVSDGRDFVRKCYVSDPTAYI